MNRKKIIIVLVLAIVAGGVYLGTTKPKKGVTAQVEHKEAGHKEDAHDAHAEKKDAHGGHDGHGESASVRMTVEMQKQNGVGIAPVKRQRIAGVISATGKIEVNGDRIAHVSPRISGKIAAVKASLGDSVSAQQVLVTLDSVELADALSRYHQSKTKFALAQSNMERIRALVDKKIAARKSVIQAEADYKNAETELHTDKERLALYGVEVGDLESAGHKKPVLPVRSPIAGIITEKHAIVGELADPSKSLYTVSDLSSVWVMVDINEKDLAKVRRGQAAAVTVGAFPDMKMKGRITYIADLVSEATRTVKARVEVANPGRKLKPEMFATVELTTAVDAPPVVAVPEEALQDMDGRKVVFIAEEETVFEARQVQTGRTSNGMVEIISGLKEGDHVAVRGSFILKSELKKGEMKDEHGHGK